MKRLLIFLVTPIVLLMICISYFSLLANTAKFPIEKIAGDERYLDNVSFTTTLGQSGKHVDYRLKNGNVEYDINRETNRENHNLNFKNLYVYTSFTYEQNSSNYEKEIKYKDRIEGDSCKIKFQGVKQGKVNYGFNDNKNSYYVQGNFRPFDFISDDDIFLEEETSYDCTNVEENGNKSINLHQKSTEESGETNQSYIDEIDNNEAYLYQNNTYFFIPKKVKQEKGELYLYKLKVSENKIDNNTTIDSKQQFRYRINQQAIATLDDTRTYDFIKIVKNKLILFSHDQKHGYLTEYSVEGEKGKEIKLELENYKSEMFNLINDTYIPSRGGDYSVLGCYQNDQYVAWNSKKYIFIVDCDSMEVVEKIKKSEILNKLSISDIYYKDGIVYCSGLTTYSSQQEIYIMKKDQLLYHGKWFLNQKMNEPEDDVYELDNFNVLIGLKVVR